MQLQRQNKRMIIFYLECNVPFFKEKQYFYTNWTCVYIFVIYSSKVIMNSENNKHLKLICWSVLPAQWAKTWKKSRFLTVEINIIYEKKTVDGSWKKSSKTDFSPVFSSSYCALFIFDLFGLLWEKYTSSNYYFQNTTILIDFQFHQFYFGTEE